MKTRWIVRRLSAALLLLTFLFTSRTVTAQVCPFTVNLSSITPATCNGTNGSIRILTPTGGQSPYTYSWNTVPVRTSQNLLSVAPGTYTLRVTDRRGCVVTRTWTVTNTPDLEPPTILCSATPISVFTEPGLCGAFINFQDNMPIDYRMGGSSTGNEMDGKRKGPDAGTDAPPARDVLKPMISDNCNVVTISGVRLDGQPLSAIYPLGNTSILWTATDAAGNTSQCTQVYTIIDNEFPVITGVPANITLNAQAQNCGRTVTWTPPTVSDNCSAVLGVNWAPGSYFNVGTQTVTYTATDLSGNTTTRSFTVTIRDVEKPIILTCAPDTTVAAGPNCQANPVLPLPIATDNCPASQLTFTNDAPSVFPTGTTVVTWTVRDTSGNSATCQQRVTVADQTAPTPVLATLPDITGVCSASVTPPTASDCSGTITATTADATTYTTQGTHIVHWTFTDASGNSFVQLQNVIIRDAVPPTIECPANITVAANSPCGRTLDPGTATGSDNCTVTISGVRNDGRGLGECYPIGTTIITWTAVDEAGNRASCQQTVIVTPIAISGTVYNDVDAGAINGTPISNADGQLYVNLVNTATNTVVASKALTNGTFSFSSADGLQAGTPGYALVLASSATATGAALPNMAEWVNTAEGIPAGLGDGTVDGTYTFGAAVTDGAVIDFGIEARPVPAVLNVAPGQVNPGGNIEVLIAPTLFAATDTRDLNGAGEVRYLHILTYPTNSNSVSFAAAATALGAPANAATYTAATFPATGVFVASNPAGNPASIISADPVDGAVNIDFEYKAIDQAGVESNNSGIARQPLTELWIAGTVYNDVDALTDASIDGTPVAATNGQPLYVNLLNSSTGAVVASRQVDNNGQYRFTSRDGLRSDVATYRLVLATAPTNNWASLSNPAAWWNTGVGSANGNGPTVNPVAGPNSGLFNFGGPIANGQIIDFGIEARPVPTPLTVAPAQQNPGGTNTVSIAATLFSANDATDLSGGEVRFLHILSFPTNTNTVFFGAAATSLNGVAGAQSYTAASFPAAGVYVATNTAGNPTSAISVDPVDGSVTIDFVYNAIDQADAESNTSGIARQPLTDLSISGTVYNDANGLTDALINGNPISNAGGQLFVNLVDAASNTVVASKTLTNGTFNFSTADGLTASNASYKLVLASTAASTSATLPDAATWVNTGEGNSGSSGDGSVNGTFSFGAVVSNGQVLDFGIEARPVPTALTTAGSLPNPGGTNIVTIAPGLFSATDATDLNNSGEVKYIQIVSFPTNTTTVFFAAASSTLSGTPATVSYTAGTFPAGGVYVATNAAGNPTSAISVDPIDGNINVDFTYKAIDQANVKSNTTGQARQPLTELVITGRVFDDADGSTDNIIDGIQIATPSTQQLYVNLVNTATGKVQAVRSVTTNSPGFSFGSAAGVTATDLYTLVLSTTAGTIGNTAPAASLPTSWVNTGEGTPATAGDATANGSYSFTAPVRNNTAIDFGIEARPVPTALTTAPSQVNPGATNFVTIDPSLFSATDATDLSNTGAVTYLHIISFPTNTTTVNFASAATSLAGTYGAMSYTAATFPAGGVYVATNAAGNPVAAIAADPVNGAVNVDFTYKAIDQANVESSASGIARQPLTELSISGKVYNDVNALTDNLINGTLISNAGGQLYVNLVNTANNAVVSSKAVTAGAYSFGTADGLQAGVTTYKLVLANSTSATAATLPNATDWLYTGEGSSATSGDGSVNGSFTFGAAVTNGQMIDFGIEARPVPASLTTAPGQVNPGGTNSVAIASTLFSGNDATDISGGEVRYIHITSFPTNTTSVTFAAAATSLGGSASAVTYTAGTFPAGGVFVATNTSGNPTSAISVDPVNGAVNVDFTYKTIDQAAAESNSAGIARQPLTEIAISGTVYDDVNGGIINGTPISNAGGQLYVNLVNTASNTVVASKQLSNGTFSFGTADGLQAAVTTYQLILTNSNAATSSVLPDGSAWVNMAEGTAGTTGDGSVNGAFTFGSAVVNGQVIDFGIDARPVPATLITAPSLVNPGATNTVTIPAATFAANDATDLNSTGEVRFIHIISFPTNTTTVTFAAASSTPGGAASNVTYTAASFPANGVYIATNTSGNPTSAITVDPVDGSVNADFTYKAVDQANVESNSTGIARQPLTELVISGKVYDDANGLTNGLIDGTLISGAGGQLYVNLVNTATNTVVSSKAVNSGSFSFSTADGLQTGITTYKLVLTNSVLATVATLPNATVWVNTGEGSSATSGDGAVNGSFTFGAAVANGQMIDFGIEARPVPASLTTAASQVNPGGTNTVSIAASLFSATDASDLNNSGLVKYLHILAFPTNTTTVNFASAATSLAGTYGAVSYTAGNFPAGGVFVATNAAGNPTSAISVDPVDGSVNVDFTYKAVDQADVESSTTGIARQPLTCAAPTITCPANITVANTTNLCGAIITITPATAASNCGIASIVGTRGDKLSLTDAFPVGTTEIIWVATASNGLSVSCTQTVTVNDTQKPTMTCGANITVANTASSTCRIIQSCGSTQHTCGSNGSNTGTAHSCSKRHTCSNQCSSSYGWGSYHNYSSSHGCSSGTSHSCTSASHTCGQTANHTCGSQHSCTARYACGAAHVCGTEHTCANTGSCNATVILTLPVASDNCGNVTVSGDRSDDADLSAPFPSGTTTIVWTATDASGNTTTCTQSVTVTDNTKPVITCPANLANVPTDANSCTATIALTAPSATDQCGTPVVSGIRSDGKPLTAPFSIGTTNITWTATDASGNAISCTQVITVKDATRPTLTIPSPIAACTNGTNTKSLTAGASDNCGVSTVTWSLSGATTGSGTGLTVTANFNIGVTTVTWTAKDASGNQTAGSTTVTISAPPAASISVSAQDDLCNSTVLTASGGTTYQWLNGTTTVGTGQTLSLPLANCSGTIAFDPAAAARDFNVFVQGGVTASSGDTHGPVAMGGNLTLGGQTIFTMNSNGYYPSGSLNNPNNYGMVIGGRVIYTSGNQSMVNQGYIRIGDATGSQIWYTDNNNASTNLKLTATGAGFNGNPSLMLQRPQAAGTATQSHGLDFSAAFSSFVNEASRINSWNSSTEDFLNKVTVAAGSNPHVTLVNNKINYINLTGTQLNTWANQGSIIFDNTPTASRPLVINVTLTTSFTWNIPNIGGLSENDAAYIIWNFNGGGTLTVGGSNPVYGTIFAPLSTVDKVNNNNLNGQIIGQSLKVGSGEIHYYPFNSSIGYSGCSNQFQLYVTDAKGCRSETPATYTYIAPANTDKYAIIGIDAVSLSDNNFVQTGSVGVNNAGGTASVQGTSAINGTGAFLKAPVITVAASSTVPTRITAQAGYQLPAMQYYTAGYSGLTAKTVAANTTGTITGNYAAVYVTKGANVTFTGTTFQTVTIEEGATVSFSSTVLNMQHFTVGNGNNSGIASVKFANGTVVRISGQMNVGLRSVVNAQNYRVTFYLGTDAYADKVNIKGGGSTVNGVIYALNGNIKVGTNAGLTATTPATALNCSQTNSKITVLYQGYTQNSNGTYTMKYKVTNTGGTDVSHIAFELPSGTASSWSNSNTNFHYTMENGTTNPYRCIKFEAACDGLSSGESDTYTYTISAAQFSAISTTRVQVKYGTTVYTATYNREGCGSTAVVTTCTSSYMNGLFIGKQVISDKCVYWNSINCGATTTTRMNPGYVSAETTPAPVVSGVTREVVEVVKETAQLKAYPNPSTGNFNVVVKGLSAGPVQVQILNTSGVLIATRQWAFSGKEELIQFQLQGISAGMYTVRITGRDGSLSTRIMIAR